MADFVCPACGSINKCSITSDLERNSAIIHCTTLNTDFYIGEEILAQKDARLKKQLFNLISELLLRKRTNEENVRLWFFVYREQLGEEYEVPYCVNLYDEMKNYPSNIVEHVNRALLNLSVLYPDVGTDIFIDSQDPFKQRLLFCTSDWQDAEAEKIVNYLFDQEYAHGEQRNHFFKLQISYYGWEKIEELTKRLAEIKQGFIAMSYSPDADGIYETFCSAIDACGYKPFAMKSKEHNNQVVPEMFFEIERSKFMVVDVTHANLGAYYEAGYAQALGKEVIVCCEKTALESDKKSEHPHFDIAQKCMVVWETSDDLKEKLIRRIQATVH